VARQGSWRQAPCEERPIEEAARRDSEANIDVFLSRSLNPSLSYKVSDAG
jgi:hypothetical protein